MKRTLALILLVVFAFSSTTAAPAKKKKKVPCRPTLAKCPLAGCGGGDPNLNRRKNIRTDDQEPTHQTLQFMKNLEDPDKEESKQTHDRALLTPLGEGETITVVAYLLAARKGSAESCNCRLTKASQTDNHLV